MPLKLVGLKQWIMSRSSRICSKIINKDFSSVPQTQRYDRHHSLVSYFTILCWIKNIANHRFSILLLSYKWIYFFTFSSDFDVSALTSLFLSPSSKYSSHLSILASISASVSLILKGKNITKILYCLLLTWKIIYQ